MPDPLDEERRLLDQRLCPRCGAIHDEWGHACADYAPRIAVPRTREAWCPCLPYMRNQWEPKRCDVCGRTHEENAQ